MSSLLHYEGLGGQVQTIYMDPPYGVKFGSNFQPFVRKRDVKHNEDEDMTREPEMVKAYRDTWELGLHSYLTCSRRAEASSCRSATRTCTTCAS
jgi:adenine-specific DNA-methyltransferase